VSADGRYVAFHSEATNLVAGDTNGSEDVFVRDRVTGTTERVSIATGGAEGNGHSSAESISADGRFVAFESQASNLVSGDTNGQADIFVRDRQTGTTERVSRATSGAQGNSLSGGPAISADGRFVAFLSFSTNLVPGDTNGHYDIFVRDRLNGTTERVSVATGGTQADGDSYSPAISADGRYVAFAIRGDDFVKRHDLAKRAVELFNGDALMASINNTSILM
jgi:Tol biopolymer transport system component